MNWWEENIERSLKYQAELEAEWVSLLRENAELSAKEFFALAAPIWLKYQGTVILQKQTRQRQADEDIADFLKEIGE